LQFNVSNIEHNPFMGEQTLNTPIGFSKYAVNETDMSGSKLRFPSKLSQSLVHDEIASPNIGNGKILTPTTSRMVTTSTPGDLL
jgi:hypothetical protein